MTPMLTLGSEVEILIPIIAIVGCVAVWIIHTIMWTIKETHATKQREQSRREIAAYIAEGTMTPEQGEKLMAAGEKPKKDEDD
jgi:NADH:ubiquinone oxidoreductase subunit 6 (subunit J)